MGAYLLADCVTVRKCHKESCRFDILSPRINWLAARRQNAASELGRKNRSLYFHTCIYILLEMEKVDFYHLDFINLKQVHMHLFVQSNKIVHMHLY